MAGQIHVVLTFDDNFWAPAYATMRGICLASRRRGEINFHALHLGISPDHKADLDKITEEFGAGISYVDLNAVPDFAAMVPRLPKRRGTMPIVYARLLIDRILPQDVTRFVFADCDMLFRAPVETLVGLDFGGKAMAAVPEPHALRLAGKRDIRGNRDLFDPAEPYFNAGLFVADIEGWRRAAPMETLDKLIEAGRLHRLYHDQDVLNLAFKGNWLALDQRWNYVDPRPAIEGLHPHVLHYTGRRKPWKPWSRVAFARIYRHVMTNDIFYKYLKHRWRRDWTRRLRRLIGQR